MADCELVALRDGGLAAGVAVEGGVEHDVDRTHRDADGASAVHCEPEVQLLRRVDPALYQLTHHLVVDDVVADLLLAEVEAERAGLAPALGLDADLAALQQGATLRAGEVVFLRVDQHCDVPVALGQRQPHLRLHCELDLLSLLHPEEHGLEDRDCAEFAIPGLDLHEDSVVGDLPQLQFEADESVAVVLRPTDHEGDVGEALPLEGQGGQHQSADVLVADLRVLAEDCEGEGDGGGVAGGEDAQVDLDVAGESGGVAVGVLGVVAEGLQEVHDGQRLPQLSPVRPHRDAQVLVLLEVVALHQHPLLVGRPHRLQPEQRAGTVQFLHLLQQEGVHVGGNGQFLGEQAVLLPFGVDFQEGSGVPEGQLQQHPRDGQRTVEVLLRGHFHRHVLRDHQREGAGDFPAQHPHLQLLGARPHHAEVAAVGEDAADCGLAGLQFHLETGQGLGGVLDGHDHGAEGVEGVEGEVLEGVGGEGEDGQVEDGAPAGGGQRQEEEAAEQQRLHDSFEYRSVGFHITRPAAGPP